MKLILSNKNSNKKNSLARVHRYYVYILLCSDKSYYVGVTNNIERRLTEHKSGLPESSYTASRGPLTLVYCEEYKHILQAIKREKYFKTAAGRRYLKRILAP